VSSHLGRELYFNRAGSIRIFVRGDGLLVDPNGLLTQAAYDALVTRRTEEFAAILRDTISDA